MSNKIKTLRHISLVLVIVTIGGGILLRTNHKTEAQSSVVCQTGYSLLVPSTVPIGNVPINLDLATTINTVQDIVFKIDSSILGRGVQVGTNPQWQMMWSTQYTNPGSHTIGVDVHFNDGSGCNIAPVITNVTGAVAVNPVLNAGVTPASYQGLTNQVINFNLGAYLSSTSAGTSDVTMYTYFNNKKTNIGSITPLDGTAILKFSTGPNAGSGYVQVTASYAGYNKIINIPVTIQAQTATISPTPTATNSGPSTSTTTSGSDSTTSTGTTSTTTSTGTTTTSTPTNAEIAAASTASIEAEKPIKDCVFTKLGDVRYKAISSGLSRPTATEFEAINQCFSTRNSVLPSSFVPVAPSEVKNKPVSKDTSVGKLDNVTSGKLVKLQIKGKSKPNTLVLLYVYSEPLVLSTTSDGNGDWNYSLEDPLQPGNHEVYAVTNKGDGTYERSSVLDFAIAKAEASPANPKSYSLKLSTIQPTAKDSDNSSKLYFGAIVLLTVIMLGAVSLGVIRSQRKKKSTNNIEPVVIAQDQKLPEASIEPVHVATPELVVAPTAMPTTPPAPVNDLPTIPASPLVAPTTEVAATPEIQPEPPIVTQPEPSTPPQPPDPGTSETI